MEKLDKKGKDRENTSFSSTLLDAIYRSIDEENEEDLDFHREIPKKNKSSLRNKEREEERDTLSSLQRVEKWTEKKVSEMQKLLKLQRNHDSLALNSTSSTSGSSFGGFSSSEPDSACSKQRIKPVRTQQLNRIKTQKTGSHFSGGPLMKESKSKSRSGDLKKSKSAISPGARLARFINSLFANTKKSKITENSDWSVLSRSSKSAQTPSTCSLSSQSRSCLSQTPFTRETLVTGVKRSVRFHSDPEVIESLREEEKREECSENIKPGGPPFFTDELKLRFLEEKKRVETAAKKLLREYEWKAGLVGTQHKDDDFRDDDEEDDGSCSSSDLFELENIGVVGRNMCNEELPVYGTTHIDENRAMIMGFTSKVF